MGAEPFLRHYPRKAEIKRAVEAAEGCGKDVAGYEVGPNGLIRVMFKQDANLDNAYDRWKAGRAK